MIDVDGVQRHTTNSHGQPIHHTEEGGRNFWKWFGDSKVVDDQGRPLVAYHGARVTIDEFQYAYTGRGRDAQGPGFYFTTNKSEADYYADEASQTPVVHSVCPS
ncbi:MAG: hypothetical protein K2X00_09800 [Nitrospiraceae bacterium]|nr:hypothetical protein [Nitrospiraceae bacterium]